MRCRSREVRPWPPLALALAVACGGGEPVLQPATIDKVASSDAQTAPAGARLPAPLVVEVRAADGTPVPRAEVRWFPAGGSGAVLSDSVTQADGQGRAVVWLQLGPAPGTYQVRAQLKALPDRVVGFTATATPPPQITAVTPGQFGGGDTVSIQGSNFEPGATVLIGGQPARVLEDTSRTVLRVRAPACLVPGSVTVAVRVRGALSNQVSASYRAASGPVQLGVGDYAAMDPSAVGGCAVFPGAGVDSAVYLLAPQSVSSKPGDSTLYRLRGDSALAAAARPAAPASLPYAVRFHDWLRQQEAAAAGLPRPALVARAPGAAPAAGISVGQQKSFRVCKIVTCSRVEDFEPVTATVKYVGSHAAVLLDNAAPSGGFSDQDLQSLGQLFDADLYDVDTRAFGVESDVDGNGILFVLLTPVVNRLTPKEQCAQSFITGFFFSVDIDPAFKTDGRSNQAEVFYGIVPDPDQTVTCRFSVASVRRLVPVTFVHELQHMISYYHHVMLRAGSTEALWLNEAMSHLAEELGGFHFLAKGDSSQFSTFALGNLFNAYKYLRNPGARFAFFGSGTGTLEERGAAWLFLRWLVDQFGEDLLRRLSETKLTGADNVAAATGEPVTTLLPQWFLANYVSDLPGFTAPPRLRYRTWSFRRTYANLNRQSPSNFDRPFPLEPPAFLGGTFDLSGVLRAASGDYLLAVQLPGQRGFGLQFSTGVAGGVDPLSPARLNVVRIR